VTLPAKATTHAILRARYTSNNPLEVDPANNTAAIFYNCADITIAESTTMPLPPMPSPSSAGGPFYCFVVVVMLTKTILLLWLWLLLLLCALKVKIATKLPLLVCSSQCV
jgi:hypothetical protein